MIKNKGFSFYSKIVILFISIILSALFIGFKPDKPVPMPTVKLRFNKIFNPYGNEVVIEMTITLKNLTNDTIRYLYWDCLSPICYSSNNKLSVDYFKGQDSICQNVNVLAPGESYEFIQDLSPAKDVKTIKAEKIKLGFIYVPIKGARRFLFIDDSEKQSDEERKQYVIWSNEVEIN